MLLVGSVGRNLGKTTLACHLIKACSFAHPVTGVKVTVIREEEACCPRGGSGCGVCGGLEQPFLLTEEQVEEGDKDTRRMKAAGARKVWWLRVRSRALEEALDVLEERIGPGNAVICESNSLRLAVHPGLFLMVCDDADGPVKATARAVIHLADRQVRTDGRRHDLDTRHLSFHHGSWHLDEAGTGPPFARDDAAEGLARLVEPGRRRT